MQCSYLHVWIITAKINVGNIRVTEMNYKRKKIKNTSLNWIIHSLLLFLFILHLPFINHFNTKHWIETKKCYTFNLEIWNDSKCASPGVIITVPSRAGVCVLLTNRETYLPMLMTSMFCVSSGDDLMRCVDLYNQSQSKWFEEMVTSSLVRDWLRFHRHQ